MQRLSVLLPVMLLALCAGCSHSAMKSTPIWDDDYGTAVGPVEDRVNLWPLVYWRKPALSVLWPLISRTDEGNAFVPFYEYTRQEDHLRLGTIHHVLPALADFNGEDETWRVLLAVRDQKNKEFAIIPLFFTDEDETLLFPLFHHDEKGVWTPLATWRKDLKGVLGPLFNRYQSGDRVSWNLPWPIAGWWRDGEERGARIFPIYGYEKDRLRSKTNLGFLLYNRELSASADHLNYLFPLGWRGHDARGSWNTLAPLWMSWKKTNGQSRFYSLPYMKMADGRSTTSLALLNGYVDRQTSGTRSQAILWPIARRHADADRRWHSVAPLYYFEETADGIETFYSPLVSWRNDGSLLNIGALLFHQTNKEGRRDTHLLWPVFHSWQDAKERGSSALPLYWLNRRGERTSLITPLGIHEKSPKGQTLMTWLGGYSRTPNDETISVLGPLFIASSDMEGKRSYRSVAWPLVHWGHRGERKYQGVFPVYFWSRQPESNKFISIPFFHDRTGRMTQTGFVLNAIGWSSSPERKASHAFPVYSWRSDEDERALSAGLGLLANWQQSRKSVEALRKEIVDGLVNQQNASSWSYRSKTVSSMSSLVGLQGRRHRLEGRLQRVTSETSTLEPTMTDKEGRRWYADVRETSRAHLFPIYSSRQDERGGRASVLWRLYDSRWHEEENGEQYSRQRVLWRLLHRETQGDKVSTDVFPFIAYDKDPERGLKQWSFAGGLLGSKRDGNERTTRIFWIPIKSGGD